VIDLSASTSPYVRFWLFWNNASSTSNLRVVASNDGGATWNSIMIVPPNFTATTVSSTSPYQRINVLIPAAYRTANTKIGLAITNSFGSNNVFIDDILVQEFNPTTITSAATGLWDAPATWVGGVVPTADNNVVIAAGHTVSMNTNIARAQNVSVDGTLQYNGTSTTQLLHVFGDLTVSGTGTYFSGNGTTGKTTYVGGNVNVSAGGTLNFAPGTSASGTLVWVGGSSAAYTNNGTLTNSRIPVIRHNNSAGVTYNSPVQVTNTFGLYTGAVNPNGNITLGNSAFSTTMTIERTSSGSLTAAPLFGAGVTRSLTYITTNFQQLKAPSAIIPGPEVEVISGVNTVTGTLIMNTADNVSLAAPMTIGTATTGGLTLTRGIIITTAANLLTLDAFVSGSTGTAPSTATPSATHGSYIEGPLRINFSSTGTTTRNFPLGAGTSFNTAGPTTNALRTVSIATTTAWAGQTITMSIAGAPSGTVNSPLTALLGTRSYRMQLNGGPALPSTATLTFTFNNSTFGNSDNITGNLQDIRIAQSPTLSGPWTERSTASGTGTITANTNYTRTTATAAPGPINSDEYFTWATAVPTLDMGATALVAPVPASSTCGGNSAQTVTVTIKNYAGATTDFSLNPVTVTVNVTGAVTQTLTTTINSGTLAPNATQNVNVGTFNMTTGGTYTFNASTSLTGDGNSANNAMTAASATTIPLITVTSSSSYLENFEAGQGSWSAGGTANSWAFGTANKTVIKNSQNSTLVGTNVWTTGGLGTGSYSSGERSFVISPCFDLSALPSGTSYVKMDAWWNSERNWDGTQLQYSTDGGTTWNNIGVLNDPYNWYNSNTMSNSSVTTFFNSNTNWWSGRTSTSNGSNMWVQAKHVIPSAALVNGVRFRIVFASDGSTQDDGFAFDNFSIYVLPAIDMAATAMTAPAAIGCYTASENVAITITNYGTATIDFSVNPVTVTVNVTGAITQTLTTTLTTGTLAPNATQSVNVGTLNMTAGGTYTFNANTSVTGDGDASNNAMTAATRSVTAPVALPQTVSFTGYTGANLSAVFPNWTEQAGTTPAGTTSAWTSYTGLGNDNNVTARINLFTNTRNEWIVGPKITAASNTILRFKAAVTNNGTTDPDVMGSDDKVRVMISANCGVTWTPVLTMDASYNLTPALTQYGINLGSYAGQDIIVAFYATDGPVDDVENYDFHIDDINLSNLNGIDMGVVSLSSPGTSGCYTSNQAVTVVIRNHGFTAVNFATDNVTVSANITGPNPQTFSTTLTSGTLAAGATMSVTLNAAYDMTAAGAYTFNASTSVATSDYDAQNNAAAFLINSSTPAVIASADVAICAGSSTNLTSTATASGGNNNLSTTFTVSTNIPILSNDTARSFLAVSSTLNATDLYAVVLDSIEHTFDSDMEITLVAPNGSRIDLSSDNGSNADNYIGTRFIPSAATPIYNGSAPFTGDFRPEQPFTALSGTANGTWTLIISDDASGDQGTIKKWSILMKQPNSIASYSWSPATGLSSATVQNPVATPSVTTTYTVTTTDANGCTQSDAVTVTVNPLPVLTATSTGVLCNGGSTGTATVSAGTGTFIYSWNTSPLQTTATATGLAAGAYTVTVTDQSTSCPASTTVTVTQPAALTAGITSTNVSCNAGSDGTAMAMPAGGTGTYSYLWSNGQTTQTATGLIAGIYSVNVSDQNACSITASVTITEPAVLTSGTVTTSVSCNGGSDGTAMAMPSGGPTTSYTYMWSNGQTTQTATGLAAGTYTVTIGSASCTTTVTATVSQPAPLSSGMMTTNVTCNGGNDGTAMAMPSGGPSTSYTYTWSNGQTTQTATGLAAGSYTVTIGSATCTTSVTATISEPTAIIASIMSSNVSCSGGNNGDAMVMSSGGPTGNYTYLWSNGGTTQTITGLSAGTYSVIINDGSCQGTASVTITEPAAVTASIMGTNVSCNGGTNGDAMVMAAGGPTGNYIYLWSNGQTTQTITGLGAGNYSVTINDGSCQGTASITITEPAAITASIIGNNVSCNGGTNGDAMVMASGGPTGNYTYLWSNGQTIQTAISLAAGIYTVTVNDGTCQGTATVTITEPAQLAASTSSTPETCSPGMDGTATAMVTGGSGNVSYSWSTSPVQTTVTATGLTAGNYTVTITDALCGPITASLTVNASSSPAITTSNDTSICAGSTVSLFVTGGGTYAWDNGAGSNDTIMVSPAATTVYSVTVDNGNGCMGTVQVTVTVIQPVTATYTYAFGNPASIVNFTNSSGNATAYSWDFGDGSAIDNSSDPSYNYAMDGTYTVTLVAENSCGSDTTMQMITIFTTGIGTNGAATMQVSPNPSEGTFILSIENADLSTLNIEVTDMQGKLVYSAKEENITSSFRSQIDLHTAAKGIYYLRLNTGSEMITKKIVIQ
jgi:subtilisin-like proprotein convertase family protein